MEDEIIHKNEKVNRRTFLKIAGISTAGAVITCSGLAYLSMQSPTIKMIEYESSGVDQMQEKVLVAYASKAGSTAEVAQAIAEEINRNGLSADVKLAKNVDDISPYRAVVIGSAIRMGNWLSEAVNLVKDNQVVLKNKPVAYFLVSGFLRDDSEEIRKEVSAYLNPVRQLVEPIETGLFAGKMDYSKLSFVDRTIAKMVKSEEGDFRDWDAIRSWAGKVAQLISQ